MVHYIAWRVKGSALHQIHCLVPEAVLWWGLLWQPRHGSPLCAGSAHCEATAALVLGQSSEQGSCVQVPPAGAPAAPAAPSLAGTAVSAVGPAPCRKVMQPGSG